MSALPAPPRTRAALALAASAAVALLGAAAPALAQERRARIATGVKGGTYEALGRRLAETIEASSNGLIQTETRNCAGSAAGARMLAAGEVDFAIVQADVLYAAARAEGKADDALRSVGALMVEAVHVVVRKGVGARSIEDLAGLRIAAGAPGSGTAILFSSLLSAYRMRPDDIERRYLTDDAALEQLLAGQIDVWVTTAAAPSARVRSALESGQATLLGLPAEDLQGLIAESPYLQAGTIDGGTYPGLASDVAVAAVPTVVATRRNVEGFLVSEMLRVMHNEREALGQVHPRAGKLDLAAMAEDLPVALHEGAAQYFQANDSLKLPVEVTVGLYCVDISGLDLKDATFRADFYIWFRWRGQYLLSLEEGFDFELVNGTITDLSHPVLERLGAWSYVVYRVKADMRGSFPLHRYPFDRQRLSIEVESPSYTVKQVVFVRDGRHQHATSLSERMLDEDLHISDWSIRKVSHAALTKVYKTDFGSPLEEVEGRSAYARYVFAVEVERELTPYVVKFVVPLIVIVLMSFSVFFIHPKEFEVQAAIVITALLSCVAFHFTQVDALPEVGYLVTADKFFLLSYVVIFLALVQLVAENHYFHRGEIEKAHTLDRWCRVLFPGIFFGVMAYLVIGAAFGDAPPGRAGATDGSAAAAATADDLQRDPPRRPVSRDR